ncbi:actin-associated protein FAM107A isoform X2 [Diorhabda carinulata]|uniref:actin-associated protein FAM107A isoform X2 n=1 Tax=Diorhabda sublineata TaxID=1163346 RepID=UPI0024E16A53|nr:actin-associated protein FAM107A isoform X2 [Diorhabda sublineata]XP_057667324.1 actin-associated protein FAM107A isoform X2 [Diorhabda carinulata]
MLDLTKDELNIKANTINHLKSKLENHDIVNLRRTDKMIPDTIGNADRNSEPILNEDGLIIPKKPVNPVKENIERQNLHRELLFNKKIGKNVLNQKTELQRALEKQKDNLAKKQLEDHIAAQTPEFEKVIADRAKRLQSSHEDKNEDDKVINKELLQIRMNLKTRSDANK